MEPLSNLAGAADASHVTYRYRVTHDIVEPLYDISIAGFADQHHAQNHLGNQPFGYRQIE